MRAPSDIDRTDALPPPPAPFPPGGLWCRGCGGKLSRGRDAGLTPSPAVLVKPWSEVRQGAPQGFPCALCSTCLVLLSKIRGVKMEIKHCGSSFLIIPSTALLTFLRYVSRPLI
ncbi:hypothetical protein E2C01_023948 [Portunus trituberculatus]|uniref:Uncharacterized protein n=1 Tax=Portunus trituberculatus TaxID=210409 RepID=A0A5B7E978_PORTR|nr:hypothetical protein [Portunus trituberculatus]